MVRLLCHQQTVRIPEFNTSLKGRGKNKVFNDKLKFILVVVVVVYKIK